MMNMSIAAPTNPYHSSSIDNDGDSHILHAQLNFCNVFL